MDTSYGTIPKNASLKVSEFNVSVPESVLGEFDMLLKLSQLAPVTYEGLQRGRLGVSTEWLQKAKEYWEAKFNWREHEKRINSYPNFTAPIVDGGDILTIHFIALFSEKPHAIPIVFLHGWPGSFQEFLPLLSLVREQYSAADLPYHIVVPSLPGYAFSSGPPTTREFTLYDVARVMNKLLVGLGFENGYVAQGGDIGSEVARILSLKYDACKGAHVNFCMYGPPEDWHPPSDESSIEMEGLKRAHLFHTSGSAYAKEHSSRPSTIGHVLSASPMSLLPWIAEKFLDWTDEDPPLETVLEFVTLYWLTQTFPRSIYPYRHLKNGRPKLPELENSKPLGFSWFPKEILPMPKSWIETCGNLVFFRRHTSGGHFAALELPATLKNDVFEFVGQIWPRAHGEH